VRSQAWSHPRCAIIQQDSHQFRDRHRGMRIVELDRNLLAEAGSNLCCGGGSGRTRVGHRASDQEILLQEAQSLAHRRGVVGIEYAGQRFCFESLAERSTKSPVAEIPGNRSSWARPQPEPRVLIVFPP